MITITKTDIVNLGYGESFASNIIRQSKALLVTRGYSFYQSKKVNRVPVEIVEEILGINLSKLDYKN